MQMKWGTCLLNPFTVSTGIRQGRAMNPYLFAVNLDEVSVQLGPYRTECTVENMVVNQVLLLMICVYLVPASVFFDAFSRLL